MTDAALFITLHFPPSRDIGAHACEQIARYFPQHGWHPVVLTRPKHLIESPDPNYRRAFPGTIVEAGLLPHPLDIYKRLRVQGRAEAAPYTLAEGGRHTSEARETVAMRLRRWVLSLLQMPDVYTGWLIPATFAGLRAMRRHRINHIISSGPYWTNHLVGLVLKWSTGAQWTAHYRDPWNQQPQTKAVSALSAHIERWLERLVVRNADHVVCVTEAHSRLLQQTFAHDKFVTIPNGYDGEEWDGVEPAPDRAKFVITYPGTFMMGTRTPRPLFRAVRQLIDAGEVDANDLRIDLFGDCDVAEGMRVADMAAAYALSSCVTIAPHQSRPETLRRIASSDLLLLLAEGWALQIPGKTYEYLRSGRPILALTGDGALRDLLLKSGGARICHPADDAAITSAIRDAYAAWKRGEAPASPDRSIVASFDRRQLAGRFTTLFKCGDGLQPVTMSGVNALESHRG